MLLDASFGAALKFTVEVVVHELQGFLARDHISGAPAARCGYPPLRSVAPLGRGSSVYQGSTSVPPVMIRLCRCAPRCIPSRPRTRIARCSCRLPRKRRLLTVPTGTSMSSAISAYGSLSRSERTTAVRYSSAIAAVIRSSTIDSKKSPSESTPRTDTHTGLGPGPVRSTFPATISSCR
jgi:hypothetical protein